VKLVEYLGHELKGESILELLEDYDMEVVYHFDRLHENSPDQYSAAAREAGFELCFDENQVLKTIFCYIQPRDDFSAVDPSIVGTAIFASLADAKAAAAADGISCEHNDRMELFGRQLSWIRFEMGVQSIHYEFSPDMLSLVTLMRASEEVV
jgi:hypothetical protein